MWEEGTDFLWETMCKRRKLWTRKLNDAMMQWCWGRWWWEMRLLRGIVQDSARCLDFLQWVIGTLNECWAGEGHDQSHRVIHPSPPSLLLNTSLLYSPNIASIDLPLSISSLPGLLPDIIIAGSGGERGRGEGRGAEECFNIHEDVSLNTFGLPALMTLAFSHSF